MSDFNQQYNRAVWLDIPVKDLARACDFYARVLGIGVQRFDAGGCEMAVLDHEQGNGGCLVPEPEHVSRQGLLVYFNAEGRLRDAVAQAAAHGGEVLVDTHSIGMHGFRAIVLDSEGNRIALHASTDA
ncbi:MAG: VOC family protein [Planctomycetes bacterium]|nr:VOC family protein [Planctomycetota bacterium]